MLTHCELGLYTSDLKAAIAPVKCTRNQPGPRYSDAACATLESGDGIRLNHWRPVVRDLGIVLTSQTTAMRQRADDASMFGVKQGLLSTNIAGLVSSISTGHIRLLAGRPCKNPGFSSLAKMIQHGISFVLLSTYAAVGLLGVLAVEEFTSDAILPTSTWWCYVQWTLHRTRLRRDLVSYPACQLVAA